MSSSTVMSSQILRRTKQSFGDLMETCYIFKKVSGICHAWNILAIKLTSVHSCVKTGVIQSNQTLVLQRVSRSQSGSYECETSNKLGQSISNTINVKIRFAPICSTEDDVILIFGVSLHESVNLVCEVIANPAQVSFNWKFQGNSDLMSFNQINDTRYNHNNSTC